MPAPIVLLVNPAAGGGRASRVARAAQEAFATAGLEIVVQETGAPGDEARIAAEASRGGARALAVVGGDGAISHAARGLLEGEAGGGARVPLAVFAAGTGNDFAKSLTAPAHDVRRMVAHVAAGATQRVDVGFVNDVPFVNAAGFGFDVAVLQRMQTPGLLRGTAAYVSTAFGALFGYRGFHTRRAGIDDPTQPTDRALMVVYANGRCFGGAFRIAPGAALDSGVLECITIRDVAPLARVPLFARAIRGTHLSSPHVQVHREGTFRLSFEAPPLFETDGELHRSATSEIAVHVRAGALTVVR